MNRYSRFLTLLLAMVSLCLSSQVNSQPIKWGQVEEHVWVTIIDHEFYASLEADEIVDLEGGWLPDYMTRVTLDSAEVDIAFVVCRSSSFFPPLEEEYESLEVLDTTAEALCSDRDGIKFHIYIYEVMEDGSVTQNKYGWYPVDQQ